MTSSEHDHQPVKFGNRWVVDGPHGRFHAPTKKVAEAMLANGGFTEKQTCTNCGRPLTWAGAWSHDATGEAACRVGLDGLAVEGTTIASPHGAEPGGGPFRIRADAMQAGHVYRFIPAAGSAVADAGLDRVEVDRIETDAEEVAVWGTWCGDGDNEQHLFGRFEPDEWVFDLTAAGRPRAEYGP